MSGTEPNTASHPWEEFRERRARKGKGVLKKELLYELRMLDHDITHAIIAFAAGSKEGLEKRRVAEGQRDAIVATLTEICHPRDEHLPEFLLGSIKETQ